MKPPIVLVLASLVVLAACSRQEPAPDPIRAARSLTIAGKSYFTTFSPDLSANNICEPAPGTGRLYVLSVINATAVTDFTGDNVLGAADRLVTLGSLIPDTPAPHFGSDKKIRLLFP